MRRMAAGLAMAALVIFVLVGAVQASEYIDLKTARRLDFFCVLRFVLFPDSPGFADVNKGDASKPGHILELADPICSTGVGFADPNVKLGKECLAPRGANQQSKGALIEAEFNVTHSDAMPAMTGHQHAPPVAWVGSIEKAYEMMTEYGSHSTGVGGFYLALGSCSGGAATEFILPESRVGPFAPTVLRAFYRAPIAPLQIVSLDAQGLDQFRVPYPIVRRAGRAAVTATTRGRRANIVRIRALDGC